jgi:hypothetical protein
MKNTNQNSEEYMLRRAGQLAFSTSLLVNLLQEASLLATDRNFVTREQFMTLARDSYDRIAKLQQETTTAYLNKMKEDTNG